MLPTAIGLITRRHKKLKSLSVLYAGFPILGMLLAFMACTFSGISLSSSATFTEVICDLGSVISFALLTALLVIIASIVTKVLVTVYTSKYNKWLKEAQACAKAAATATDNTVTEEAPAVEEIPTEQENTEETN